VTKNITLRVCERLAGRSNDPLRRYWDTERNGDLPEVIDTKSQKMTHWKCDVDASHRWYCTIKHMTANPFCPGCNPGAGLKMPKKAPNAGESLADICPDASANWNSVFNGALTPSMLTSGNPYSYWWRCDKHETNWLCAPWYISSGRICPLCSRERSRIELKTPAQGKSFGDLYKELAEEWDYSLNETKPEDHKPNTKDKFHWICRKHDKKYFTSILARTKGVGCSQCTVEKISKANAKPKPGRSLAEMYPEIAAEFDEERNGGLTARDVSRKSGIQFYWICPRNNKHHYLAAVHNRVDEQSSCPYCSGATVFPGETDIATTHPWLLEEWDDERNEKTPQDVTAGSHYHAAWICKNDRDHKWYAEVKSRALYDAGCPHCRSRIVGDANATPKPGESLRDMFPEVADELNVELSGISSEQLCQFSGKSVFWNCRHGHDPYERQVCQRTALGFGCPRCARIRGASFPESAVYYYVKQAFADAEHDARGILKGAPRLEFDVWIPSLKTAIEYDGEYWHLDKRKDLRKDNECAKNGISLIRIREPRCADYNVGTSTLVIRRLDTKTLGSLDDAIRKTMTAIGAGGKVDINTCRDSTKIRDMMSMFRKGRDSHDDTVVAVA